MRHPRSHRSMYAAPAGQVATPPPPAAAPSPPPPVAVGPDGRIAGIDGMLDQLAAAAARQARLELLPVLQADRETQRTIGRAAGRELAKPLWALALLAGGYVGYRVWRAERRDRARR